MAKCSECGSEEVYKYKKPVTTHGGYGPNLIPQTGRSIFSPGARVETFVCTDCGLVRLYAVEETRAQIGKSKHWKRV